MSEWIPFKVKTVHGIREFVGDIPQDGQKVLISNNPYVFADTFCNDEDGCYLDDYIGEIKDGMAWMPLPEPYKGRSKKREIKTAKDTTIAEYSEKVSRI